MPDRIDDELARIEAQGRIPKKIWAGINLFSDLSAEQNESFGGNLESSQWNKAGSGEVTEYKGIPVELKDGVENDYLEIETV